MTEKDKGTLTLFIGIIIPKVELWISCNIKAKYV